MQQEWGRTSGTSFILKTTTPWCSGVSSVIRPRCAFTTWLPYRNGISPFDLIQTCRLSEKSRNIHRSGGPYILHTGQCGQVPLHATWTCRSCWIFQNKYRRWRSSVERLRCSYASTILRHSRLYLCEAWSSMAHPCGRWDGLGSCPVFHVVQYCRRCQNGCEYAYYVVGKFCEDGFTLFFCEGTHGEGLVSMVRVECKVAALTEKKLWLSIWNRCNEVSISPISNSHRDLPIGLAASIACGVILKINLLRSGLDRFENIWQVSGRTDYN